MTYRLYFNRCEDWPQIWSIDRGTVASEVNVCGFRFAPGVQVVDGRAENIASLTPEQRQREPIAWCAVTASGLRIVDDGIAWFDA